MIFHVLVMWKAAAGHGHGNAAKVPALPQQDDDDWETDPDFVNDVTEQEQRWGAKTVEGSGRTGGTIEYVISSCKKHI